MQPDKPAPAITEVSRLAYAGTGYFSKIVTDYLAGIENLRPFYQHRPDLTGIRQAIAERKQVPYQRAKLVSALKEQYNGIELTPALQSNLDLLLRDTTFTITTAHQPNIFTGPLYFIYKIFHAIKLAETLKREIPANDFVPVFFMGSEDADLDELGNITVEGKKYNWQTRQTGAVGRMKADKSFISMVDALAAQLEVHPHGDEIIGLFRSAYKEGKTIQQATLEIVNSIFGDYGLVVLLPDAAALKQMFAPIVQRELNEQFSHKAVESTSKQISRHYKVQVEGRELNLFYLLDDKRERIEKVEDGFAVPSLGLRFTAAEMERELSEHPECFSPNVILRGVFQELVLPNIAFIGGGAEIAYWLELKQVFETAGVPFPVLLLRNSFLLATAEQWEQLSDLGFTVTDFFKSTETLLNEYTLRESANQLSLSEEFGELNSFYQQLHETTLRVDASLAEHVNALQAQALKRITELEKKLLRAEKRKFEVQQRRIQKLKNTAFPGGSLQERVENVSSFYARYGKGLLSRIYQHSPALEQHFTVITI